MKRMRRDQIKEKLKGRKKKEIEEEGVGVWMNMFNGLKKMIIL